MYLQSLKFEIWMYYFNDSPASTTKNIVTMPCPPRNTNNTLPGNPHKKLSRKLPVWLRKHFDKNRKKIHSAEPAVLNLLSRKQNCRSRKLRGRACGRVAICPIKIWRKKNSFIVWWVLFFCPFLIYCWLFVVSWLCICCWEKPSVTIHVSIFEISV